MMRLPQASNPRIASVGGVASCRKGMRCVVVFFAFVSRSAKRTFWETPRASSCTPAPSCSRGWLWGFFSSLDNAFLRYLSPSLDLDRLRSFLRLWSPLFLPELLLHSMLSFRPESMVSLRVFMASTAFSSSSYSTKANPFCLSRVYSLVDLAAAENFELLFQVSVLYTF